MAEPTYADIRRALAETEARIAARGSGAPASGAPAGTPSEAASPAPAGSNPDDPVGFSGGDPDSVTTRLDRLPTVDPDNQIKAGLEGAVRGIPLVGKRFLAGAQHLDAYIDSWLSGTSFEEALKKRQAESTELASTYRGSSLIGEIAGNVGGMGAALGAASQIPRVGQYAWHAVGAGQNQSWIARMVAGGLSSGGLAAGEAAIEGGDARVIQNAAVTSGIVGMVAAPLLGRIMGRAAADRSPSPGIEAIQGAARNIVQASEQLGVGLRPTAVQNFMTRSKAALGRDGYSPEMHTPLAAFMRYGERIAQRGVPMELREVELMRRHLSAAMRSTEGTYAADTRRLAGVMADRLDDWVTNASASMLVRTNPAGPAMNMTTQIPPMVRGPGLTANPTITPNMSNRELAQANRVLMSNFRELWRRQSAASRIEDAIEVAARDRYGLALGMHGQFKTLAGNERFMRQLRPPERAEIERLANSRTWRGVGIQVSRADPTRGGFGAHAGVGAMAAAAVTGNVLPAALPAAGYLSGKIVDRGATRMAQDLASDVIRGQIRPRVDPSGRTLGTLLGIDDSQRLGEMIVESQEPR